MAPSSGAGELPAETARLSDSNEWPIISRRHGASFKGYMSIKESNWIRLAGRPADRQKCCLIRDTNTKRGFDSGSAHCLSRHDQKTHHYFVLSAL